MKRELLKIPFFGWGLRLIRPIAIDRNAGKAAVKQISHQGKALLQEGICVVIFPEGTRVAPDANVPFKIGGAILASHSGFPAGSCGTQCGVKLATPCVDQKTRYDYRQHRPGVCHPRLENRCH
ncbi:lysophospholipid acyltransferase family protein [Thiothrix subterranea]|uniref:lysophospholipid acyltransferase family protein n=1 Tax=Thiothrix subterranea TaxID=2735563 RepID=UPI00280AA451|nr:lysophospholipid acyltransferase family protein [Thiothrix subterranea]